MEIDQGIQDHAPQPDKNGNARIAEVAGQPFLRFQEPLLQDITGIQTPRQARVNPQFDDLAQPSRVFGQDLGQCLVAITAQFCELLIVICHKIAERGLEDLALGRKGGIMYLPI